MQSIKNFFALFLFVAVAAAFNTTSAAAQTAGSGDPALIFNAENMDQWNVARIPATLREGQTVIATNKTDKMQVIVVVRGGKIAQMATKSPTGKLAIQQPSAGGPCSTIHCTTFQIAHCYYVNGSCFCVCGSWITSYPNP